jgi:hypothetical protein
MTDTPSNLDLLYGARKIAEFMWLRERVAQHLIETKRIPYFKIGKTVGAYAIPLASRAGGIFPLTSCGCSTA